MTDKSTAADQQLPGIFQRSMRSSAPEGPAAGTEQQLEPEDEEAAGDEENILISADFDLSR